MTPASYAIVLLVVGNLLATLSDVAVKLIDGNVSPFQYMFLRQLFSLLMITPLWLMQRKTQRALAQPRITLVRAHLILIGSGCMMVSITYLPLATANAVFYAAPLLMLPLSVWLLKEKPALAKVLGTLVGFVGMLVVLRPSQFHWAACFALGTALTLAFFNVLVRKLPAEQTVVTTLWWTTLLSLPVSLLLALLYWQPLTPTLAAYIFASSVCILGYNGLAVAAYRKAPAGQIALAEYSGLLFVTLIGMYAFAEHPDLVTWAGILLIVLPLFPWQSVFAKLRNGRSLDQS
ncbi:EamA family transporter [Vibrio navarrensis]|uniref:DMT family transporter n=1 Tax=Vibrio navarrensis TaxID=29495 RepID=UPI00186993C9|nr:DMT family transporter [Vibrio navarrensis]MBE3670170.1 EamA family transporter [Vibrio navarrensis]MBE4592864.1 EamA family transporter [Vibrio navarrensis]